MITPSFNLTATERVLPKLALDFTTASLDPRVTFTRSGATATCVNSLGYVAAVLANTPRFDYNPATLVCKGLLVEESRTNFALYSAQFNDAAWSKANSSVDQDLIVSPDGTQNADFLKENSATSTHFVNQLPTLVDNTAYALSCYAKKGTRNWFVLGIVDKAAASKLAYFDLNAGVVGNVSTGVTSSITDAGNGWYRCVANVNSSAGATPPQLRVMLASANGTISYAGNGTSGLYIWGAQLEAGAFATSYIPTVASQVSRTADVATMTGTNFSNWYVAGAGGVVGKVLPSTVSGTRPVIQFDDTTSSEVIALRGNTTNPELYIVDAGTPQAQIDAGTITANTIYNLGAAWNTNNCAAAVNGGAAVTDNSVALPTVTQARLGNDGTNYLNGQLQTVRYWPQRLIDAEVQAFSKG